MVTVWCAARGAGGPSSDMSPSESTSGDQWLLATGADMGHLQPLLCLLSALAAASNQFASRTEVSVYDLGGNSSASILATPVRRQACTLLCALACTDPHECDTLLDWPFRLGAGADAPLALHLLMLALLSSAFTAATARCHICASA